MSKFDLRGFLSGKLAVEEMKIHFVSDGKAFILSFFTSDSNHFHSQWRFLVIWWKALCARSRAVQADLLPLHQYSAASALRIHLVRRISACSYWKMMLMEIRPTKSDATRRNEHKFHAFSLEREIYAPRHEQDYFCTLASFKFMMTSCKWIAALLERNSFPSEINFNMVQLPVGERLSHAFVSDCVVGASAVPRHH